jgi:hypothetical protein
MFRVIVDVCRRVRLCFSDTSVARGRLRPSQRTTKTVRACVIRSLPLLSVHCLDSPPRMRFYDAVSIWWLLATYQLTYLQPEAIGHFLSPREEPSSMLLDRGDEEDGLTLSNSTSRPFMSMFICGLFVY